MQRKWLRGDVVCDKNIIYCSVKNDSSFRKNVEILGSFLPYAMYISSNIYILTSKIHTPWAIPLPMYLKSPPDWARWFWYIWLHE